MTTTVLAVAFALALPMQDAPGSIPLDEAERALQVAKASSASDDGKLWGQRLYGSMLFVDPVTRDVVANRADDGGLLVASGNLFVGRLPETVGIANTATTWSGTEWTMLMWPLPENRYDRRRLLMHESFHRIQRKLNLPAGNPENAHLDEQGGRTWLRLEWRALSEALIHEGTARDAAMDDALCFRTVRRRLHPEGVEDERKLELNEGLAEYTGVRLSGWPDPILADRVAVRLENDERGDSFARSFAYASGPAYGLLLDAETAARSSSGKPSERPPPWRKTIRGTSDLGDMLAALIGWTAPEKLGDTARARASRYGGDEIIAEEARRADLHEQLVAKHRTRFLEGPVLVLPLGTDVRYTFNPHGVDALGKLGSVYSPTRVTDDWGILEADAGALLSRNARGGMSTARVPAPADAKGRTVSGDGWTLTLNQGWTIVDSKREGDVTVSRTP